MNKFVKRKIVAVVVASIAVFSVYQYNVISIESQINPQTVVFSTQDIAPQTVITEEMVQERMIPGNSIPPNVLRNKSDIIGKWTVDGYGVSRNSYFYEHKVVPKSELPDAAILNLELGEYAFPLLVDIETSSGNSLMPQTYVDLYFATMQTETGQPLFGKLADRVRITSVKDSSTVEVFTPDNYTESHNVASSSKNKKTMARLYTLAVDGKQLNLLNKAKMLGQVIPVASGRSYLENDEIDIGDIDPLEQSLQTEDFVIRWIEEQTLNDENNEEEEETEE